MEIKTKKYSLELTQNEIDLLEEELFNLHIWCDNRNSPLNKHKIQKGDYPSIDKLYSLISKCKGGGLLSSIND